MKQKFILEFEGEFIPDMIFPGTAIDEFLKSEEYDCIFCMKEIEDNYKKQAYYIGDFVVVNIDGEKLPCQIINSNEGCYEIKTPVTIGEFTNLWISEHEIIEKYRDLQN